MIRYLKYIASILILCYGSESLYSQSWQPSVGIWKFNSLHGELKMKGTYSSRNSVFNEIPEEQSSTYFIGGVSLNSKSYLWKPDVVAISLNGEFNPETRNEKYLSVPDRAEVRTLSKLDFRTSVFSNKTINLTTFLNLDQNYFNRENLTNIKSNNRQYGGVYSYQNKILPVSLSFRKLAWEQTETESGRVFKMDQENLQFRATKTFYKLDKHAFNCELNNYDYQYSELSNTHNTILRVVLNDQFYFDDEKDYSFNSTIQFHKQDGNQDFYKIDASERLSLKLPYNLLWRTSYNYYFREDAQYEIVNHRVRSSFRHQLFKSLESSIYIDIPVTKHTLYHEQDLKSGIDIRYTKKTFFGRLNLGYSYYHHYNFTESEQGDITVTNEEQTFDNTGTFLLSRPFVNVGSILLTDINGTIIYQEGIDYLVNTINDYVEIIRIPGGLLEEEQSVLIDYTAIQPASYQYNANNNSFNSSLVFLDNLIELYYRHSSQHFRETLVLEYLTLNQYNQNIAGGRIHYKFLSGGMEYDLYHSNLIPYKKINYYLNLNFKFGNRILLSMNGLLRDYKVLDSEVDHRYINISARLAYNLSQRSKLNIQAAYLKQVGRNIDLDLLTGKLEFIVKMRKLYFTSGLNLYNRSYINNDYNYRRTYIQLVRKF